MKLTRLGSSDFDGLYERFSNETSITNFASVDFLVDKVELVYQQLYYSWKNNDQTWLRDDKVNG
jgi:hypothetical protein